jgi:plastocyanin
MCWTPTADSSDGQRSPPPVGHTVSFTATGIASGVLNNGDQFTQTFTSPGTYPYICAIHPFMHTVVVTP